MRVSRIFCDQPLVSGTEIELDTRTQHYVRQVLRLRSGQALVLFNGDGRDVTAELTACDRRGCRARVGEVIRNEAHPELALHLGIGISRGERMDVAIQKAVELGVQTISPLQTKHGGVRLSSERLPKRIDHWRGIVISACEQSGRSQLPTLNPPRALDSWLNDHPRGIMLHPLAEQSLPAMSPPGDKLTLLVGPEGGLNETEVKMAQDAGFTPVRLGPRVLRTETAPLAALAAIQVLWGDFR